MKILLIEDDLSLTGPLLESLSLKGIEGKAVTDGLTGLQQALSQPWDAVVLDIGLPGMDGLEVLRRIRESGSRVPVILLTSRDSTEDIVLGLDLGADDYLPKPFRTVELRARLGALDRRVQGASQPILTTGKLEMDLGEGRVKVGNRTVKLTRTEGSLLRTLMSAKGAPVSREDLLESVWKMDFDPGTNLVEACVARLRKKLEAAGEARVIHTVQNVGYRCD